MADWIPGDSINCIYFVFVMIGLVYTVISVIGADLGGDVDVGGPDLDFHIGDFDIAGIHVPDVDLGVDAPDIDVGGEAFHLPALSPFTVASALTGAGASGIVATLVFNVSWGVSILWALGGAVLLGGAIQLFVGSFLLKSQGSSQLQVGQMAGKIAEVTVPIESQRNGQIAFVVQGRRATYRARSAGETEIPRGAQVEIVRVVGGTAVVRRLEEE